MAKRGAKTTRAVARKTAARKTAAGRGGRGGRKAAAKGSTSA